jgi:hypothetical protein
MSLQECAGAPESTSNCIFPKRDDEDDEMPIEGNDNLPLG